MSSKLLSILVLCFVWPLLAEAKPKIPAPEEEIVYRANLGRADDVKLLISQGVSPDTKDAKDVPILSLASLRKDDEGINVVKALIEAGADVNATDPDGQTALFYAARSGNGLAVRELLASGIEYYHMDNRGNIARTIAHNRGHSGILEYMDDFVRNETERVMQEYYALRDKLLERYDEQQRNYEEFLKQAQQAAITNNKQAQTALQEQQARMKKEQEALEMRRSSEEYVKIQKNIAFESCAFQYWTFCQDTGTRTEFSLEQLLAAIEAHKMNTIKLMTEAQKTYQTAPGILDSITENAKRRIFNELQDMPSKIYRRERGVGSQADMRTRCQIIATRWNEIDVVNPDTAFAPSTLR